MIDVNKVLVGDAAQVLPRLSANSIDNCVTSPPYYMLRDYGVDGQIGLEADVGQWVEHLHGVFHEVGRVLKPGGTLWLNVADGFSRDHRYGAPPKSLLLGPERLILRLQQDGWVIRNRMAWVKSNPRPASVRDRLSSTWELVYLLVRSPRYYFDLDAVRVPHRSKLKAHPSLERRPKGPRAPVPAWAGPLAGSQIGLEQLKARGLAGNPLGKNPGDVITTAGSRYKGAHFATFPPELVRPLLRAGCPERVCDRCGVPWERQRAKVLGHLATIGELVPGCSCGTSFTPGVVLDPFMGAGTVALVAEELGRRWLGVELNPAFVRLTHDRLEQDRGRQAAA